MYWSSTDLSGGIYAGSHGHVFFIDSGTATLTSGWYSTGFTVRCVEKVPSPPTAPDPPVIADEKAPYLLYMNNGKLDLGQWTMGPTQANMIFTKLGSVVGFLNNNDAWTQSKVVFEPSATKSTTYASIPAWNGGPNTEEGYITTAAYHNDTNLRQGRGDICKLVGLTSEQAMVLAKFDVLDEYDSGFRLATRVETVYFTNTPTSNYTSTASQIYPNTALRYLGTNGSGAWFPILGDQNATTGRTTLNNDPAGFLPCAGNRQQTGATNNVTQKGFYWTSTPYDANQGFALGWGQSNICPANLSEGISEHGHAIRCVRKDFVMPPPPTAPDPPVIADEKAPYLLYMNNGKLDLGRWKGVDPNGAVTQANLVFSKYGSVVGLTNDGSAYNHQRTVIFEPSTTPSTTFANIPGWINYTGSKPGGQEGYLSSASYHNDANLANGRGDICKLVGLTTEQAKALAAAEILDEYDSGFRLPTLKENVDFTNTPTAAYTAISPNYSDNNLKFWDSGNKGFWFPIPGDRNATTGRTVRNNNPAGFLPATGNRTTNGASAQIGGLGTYWSSMSPATGYFCGLEMNALGSPAGFSPAFYELSGVESAATVRCVPKTGQEIPPPMPTEPYILYWDEASQTMVLGAWGAGVTQANMVFAQFGSTVGFLNNNDAWATDGSKIVFNPTSKTNATMGAAYSTAIPNWDNYNGTKPATYTPTDDGYISAASYHTRDNVLAGFGDICKLAGLTVEQVRAGIVDNKKYRLPTDAENNTDYGSGTQFIGTQGSSGRGLQKTGNTATFLPAAGYRVPDTSGSTGYVYSNGYYWSNRPDSATYGYGLGFGTSVNPSGRHDVHNSFAVRCVPQ